MLRVGVCIYVCTCVVHTVRKKVKFLEQEVLWAERPSRKNLVHIKNGKDRGEVNITDAPTTAFTATTPTMAEHSNNNEAIIRTSGRSNSSSSKSLLFFNSQQVAGT